MPQFWANSTFMGVRVAEFKFLVHDQNTESNDTWPRSSPFQASVSQSLYGGKVFDLYIDPKEEHALGPLKQQNGQKSRPNSKKAGLGRSHGCIRV